MSDDDLLAGLSSLPSNYSSTEIAQGLRYHDFRRLFMSSPEGKRVLSEIIAWGRIFQPAVIGNPIDPYLTHFRDGEANIARKLLATVIREPAAPPTVQKRQPVKRPTKTPIY